MQFFAYCYHLPPPRKTHSPLPKPQCLQLMGCQGSQINLVESALGNAQWSINGSLLGWPISEMGNDCLCVRINCVGRQESLWYVGVSKIESWNQHWMGHTISASISSLKWTDRCWISKIRGCYRKLSFRKLLTLSYFPLHSVCFRVWVFGVFLFDEENAVGSGCSHWMQYSDTTSCRHLSFGHLC